jgi:isopentenyldiphosphate isomerase
MKEFIYVYYYKTKKFNPTINWEVKETAWKSPKEIKEIIKSGNISPVCVAAIKKANSSNV